MSCTKRRTVFLLLVSIMVSAIFAFIFFRIQVSEMTPPDFDLNSPGPDFVTELEEFGSHADLFEKFEILTISLLVSLAFFLSTIEGVFYRFCLSFFSVFLGISFGRFFIGLDVLSDNILNSYLVSFFCGIFYIVSNCRSFRIGALLCRKNSTI